MGCEQCHDEEKTVYAAVWVDPEQHARLFCSASCLRTWLAPDRSLLDRVKNGEVVHLSPQDVVVQVLTDHWAKGESALGCPDCAAVLEEIAKSLLR